MKVIYEVNRDFASESGTVARRTRSGKTLPLKWRKGHGKRPGHEFRRPTVGPRIKRERERNGGPKTSSVTNRETYPSGSIVQGVDRGYIGVVHRPVLMQGWDCRTW